MFNTIVGTGAVGAGAASRYSSGSNQKMRLRLRNTGSSYVFLNAKQNTYNLRELAKKSGLKQKSSVAEPHHFYAAPAPGKIIDAAPAGSYPTV
jgi:hypothetical protein